MSYKTRLLSALREKQSMELGLSAATVGECVMLAEEIPEEDGWISVKDRLPEEFASVLVHIPGESPLPTVCEAFKGRGYWSTKHSIFSPDKVTHWMPLPEPPKEGM